MKRVLALAWTLSCLLVGPVFAQPGDSRLEALKKYVLEKDYPEVFGESHYKTRIESLIDVDIDNDGSKELIVLYFPHYRQSAPVVIYKISPDLTVARVTEGLAPGPLQKLSGDYLDSHALGKAADFEISGDAKTEDVVRVMFKNGMNGLVRYDTFYHVDDRAGLPSFIDMRGVQMPSKNHDCSAFEFSRVKQIAVGGLREDPSRNYLAAWVGDEIYLYLIRGISNEGMLDKKLWVLQTPKGFQGFEPGKGLAYKTETGTAVLTLK